VTKDINYFILINFAFLGFGIDDKMAEGKTDKYGQFLLQGSEKEVTSIDPKVNIYHVGVPSIKQY
jgi:hypothetical protein